MGSSHAWGSATLRMSLTCVSNANVDDRCLVLLREVLWGGREGEASIFSLGHLEDPQGVPISQPDDEGPRDKADSRLSHLKMEA